MANPDIGTITCPITGETGCAVRRYSRGKRFLYYVSQAGMITPNLPAGQAYMEKHTTFIGDNGKPLAPVNGKPASDNQPENPVNDSKPVNDNKGGGLLSMLFTD